MPLSLQRTHVIRALCNFLCWYFCITIVTVCTFLGQSDQMRWQNVRNWMVFKILTKICQYDKYFLSYEGSKSLELTAIFIWDICITIVAQMSYQNVWNWMLFKILTSKLTGHTIFELLSKAKWLVTFCEVCRQKVQLSFSCILFHKFRDFLVQWWVWTINNHSKCA